MSDRYLRIPSQSMGRKVHLWCYGHFGPPIVVFPSAAGFAHEWQQQGMIDVLRPLLNAGKIKLYCPESNVAEAWTRKEGTLEERMFHHHRYEQFILNDLTSFIADDCNLPNPPLQAIGCSLGAMYAANFALEALMSSTICGRNRYCLPSLERNSQKCVHAQKNNIHRDLIIQVPVSLKTIRWGKHLREEKL